MNIKINLLPDLILQQRREARIRQFIDIAFIAWLALLALFAMGLIFANSLASNKLENAERAQEELDDEVNSEANVAFRREASQVQVALNSIQGFINGQNQPGQMLETLALSTPEGVSIREISVTESGTIFIDGNADSNESVAQLIAGLNDSKQRLEGNEELGFFLNTYLDQTALSSNSEEDISYTFSLTTSFQPNLSSLVEETPLQGQSVEEETIEPVNLGEDRDE